MQADPSRTSDQIDLIALGAIVGGTIGGIVAAKCSAGIATLKGIGFGSTVGAATGGAAGARAGRWLGRGYAASFEAEIALFCTEEGDLKMTYSFDRKVDSPRHHLIWANDSARYRTDPVIFTT